MQRATDPLPEAVIAAIAQGNTIEAIKLLREATGLGLKEAKDAVERHMRGQAGTAPPTQAPAFASSGALPPDVVDALRRGRKVEAIRVMKEQTGMGLREAKLAVEAFAAQHGLGTDGLAPGEMPRSRWGVWLFVGAALLAYLLYRLYAS